MRTASTPNNEVELNESDPASKPSRQSVKRKTVVPNDGEAVPETRNQQGHRIQAVMNSGLFTPNEIAQKTGLSLKRVWNHVNYEVGKLRAEVNDNDQVVVLKRPRHRLA